MNQQLYNFLLRLTFAINSLQMDLSELEDLYNVWQDNELSTLPEASFEGQEDLPFSKADYEAAIYSLNNVFKLLQNVVPDQGTHRVNLNKVRKFN